MCENLTELNVSMNSGLTCIKVSAFQLDAINNNDQISIGNMIVELLCL